MEFHVTLDISHAAITSKIVDDFNELRKYFYRISKFTF